MRFLKYDLKRIFARKSLLMMCLLTPVIIMLVFATIFTPLIFTGKGLHFNLAILEEDKGQEVGDYLNQLLNSQSFVNLVSSYPVSSLDVGLKLVEDNKVSVLIQIPKDFYHKIKQNESANVNIYSKKSHTFEVELVSMIMNASILLTGKSMNMVEAVEIDLEEMGFSEKEITDYLFETKRHLITGYMSRRKVTGSVGIMSTFVDFISMDYYLTAIFTAFTALSILPLIYFSAMDIRGAILRRGLLCGVGTSKFYMARIVSGVIFTLLVQLMVIPTTIALTLTGDIILKDMSGNVFALVLTLIFASLCFSSMALFVATHLPNVKSSLWFGFFLVLFMSVASGVIISGDALPEGLFAVGRWLPLRSSMRMLSGAMFSFHWGTFMNDFLKTFLWSAFFLIFGYRGLKRREAY